MRIYLDSSALIKRVIRENHSVAFRGWMRDRHAASDIFVSSSLAWVEVTRALRNSGGREEFIQVAPYVEAALAGVAEFPMSSQVVSLARRVGPPRLRSLDAIHLASALLLDADEVITYDDRLAAACVSNGLSNHVVEDTSAS